MLPSDFSPEKRMRQRFVKREADMRRGFLVEEIDLIEADDPLVRAFGFQDELGMIDWASQFAREKKDVTSSDRKRLPNKRPVLLVRFVNAAAAKKGTEAVKRFSGLALGLKRLKRELPALKLSEATLNRRVTISFPNVGKRVEAMKAAVAQGWTTEKEITSFSFSDVRFEAKGSKPLGKLATLMKKFRGSVSNSQLPHGGLTGQGGSTIVKPS